METLRDSSVEFTQEYDVTIRSQYDTYTFKDMITEIEFEKNSTLAYLVIKKGSKLAYTDELYGEFINYIVEQ